MEAATKTTRDKTTKDLAGLFKVHVSTITNWVKRGCPHDPPKAKKQSSMFNVAEVKEWIAANNVSGRTGRPHSPSSEEKSALELRKLKAAVERAERENAISKGLYILAADEQVRDVQKIAAIRNKLTALGATLAPQLVGQDGLAIQDLIDKATTGIMDQFSKGE